MEHPPSKLIARFAVAGMSNRRALLEELEHRLATGEQLVVALADLNGFKHCNDTYGHPAGDALLRRLAARLVDACPAGTTAARLGGDEFCVLAPATVDDEELRTRVSSALSEQGEGFSISAACGTAHVRRAAELHDIGKVAIPASILTKPGSLTAEEWDFIRRHTVIGERILAVVPALADVAGIVRASHERWDGNGYPDRIAGREIPLAARIVAVADSYCAMTENRPYAQARPAESAIAELRSCAGTQFDPRVVAAFLDVLAADDHHQPLELVS